MIGGQGLHFIISVLATIAIGAFIKPDKMGKWLPFILVMMLGCLKEIYDLTFNPWDLSAFYLTLDSVCDILSNVAGSLVGMFALYKAGRGA